MGLRAMWFSSVGAIVGALMYWVLTYQDTGLDLRNVGVVFMIGGVVGFAISSVIVLLSLRRPSQRPLRGHQPSASFHEHTSVAHGEAP